jgi:hypothetical protein
LFAVNLPSTPVLNQMRVEVRDVNSDANGFFRRKGMRKLICMTLLTALFLAVSLEAGTAGSVVLGDSLGVGVAAASGLKSLARISVHIRGPKAIQQINRVPPGSTAYLVLGTNDAVGPVGGLERSIDNIVRAADQRNIKLVWIGPPCVRKAWDRNSIELDRILRARLASTSVRYVGMRDEGTCSARTRAGDGVHMTMGGYGSMWEKARGTNPGTTP